MGVLKNFAYNGALTVSNYLVGLIIFPYISRVLGVSNIGIVNFVDNILNYFILFAALGIEILGVREIAKKKNNLEELKQVFYSLALIHFILTSVLLVTYFGVVFLTPQLYQYKELFFIGTAKIFFSAFLFEWVVRGLEDFKYIAYRSLMIKFLYVLCVFLCVKKQDDYILYYVLTISTIIINSLVNSIYVQKYMKTSAYKIYFNILPFLKKYCLLGIYLILTSFYTTFNVVYLGFVSTVTEVGYYTTALKIYTLILGLFTAFSMVLLPRLSAMIADGNKESFNKLIDTSINILVIICIPLSIFTISFAPDIIQLLCGNEYIGAVLPMQFIMPLIVIVAAAQIFAIQVLMPLSKDKIVLWASLIGMLIGIWLNLLLVKEHGALGSAIVLLISELVVTSCYVVYIAKTKLVTVSIVKYIRPILLSLPYLIIAALLNHYMDFGLKLYLAVLLYILYFLINNILLHKDTVIKRLIMDQILCRKK